MERRRRMMVAAAVVAVVLAVVTAVVVSRPSNEGTSVLTTPTTISRATATSEQPPAAPPTSPSTSASDASDLPGERQEVHPYERARLAVVGVAAGDVLNIRSGPGVANPVLFTAEPLADDLEATGHNRLLAGTGYWSEVRRGDRTGWGRTAFLLQLGTVDDVTSQLYPSGTTRPTGALAQLADDAARKSIGDGRGDTEPTIVIVDGPSPGDVGEVVVDVLGIGDDAIGGYRVVVFAEPSGRDRYTTRSVERTTLCRRSVTADGTCV